MAGLTTALIAGAATLGGAALASNASNRQTQAQQQTTQTNNALQQQIFNQQRADLAPWRTSGANALTEINRRLGLGQPQGQTSQGQGYAPVIGQPQVGVGGYPMGGGQNLQARMAQNDFDGLQPVLASAMDAGGAQINPGLGGVGKYGSGQVNPGPQMTGTNTGPQINPGPGGVPATTPTNPTNPSDPQNRYGGFYASPGYQFRMDEGNRSINANRAASGMLQSGDTLRALQRYGQDYASNEYNTQLNQLFNVAGLGQTATGQGNALAGNYANQVGANNQVASNALQSSYGTQANAWGNALGQIGGYAAYAWPQQQGSGFNVNSFNRPQGSLSGMMN